MEQTTITPEELWFNTPDSQTLCRGGGNGPNHPSQLYAIKKYVDPSWSFLDYGSGSGTTLEAMVAANIKNVFKYRGLDIIPKNIEWCRDQFKGFDWKINKKIHEIDELDQSWDVVYSRHVVDHMDNFEHGLDEHCRVAKKLVIIILWVPLSSQPEHGIKNIVDQGKVYENEYTNQYSRPKVMEAIKAKEKDGWKLLEFAEDIGKEINKHDVVIVLKRDEVT